jgi:hypothetical protein
MNRIRFPLEQFSLTPALSRGRGRIVGRLLVTANGCLGS